jgi:hypothetical protein
MSMWGVGIFHNPPVTSPVEVASVLRTEAYRRPEFIAAGQSPPSVPIYMDRHQDWAAIVCLVGAGRPARCGGKLKVIASIEEPAVIAKILAHLERRARDQHQTELPLGARAPPVQSSLL